jgi:RNA polymerase sigma-70 factor (family 1)
MVKVYLNSLENPGSVWDLNNADHSRVEAVVIDDELFLRSTFQESPQKGCELLFRRYYVNLCNHAIRFVHSKEVAEDIVSEVFTNFWQNETFKQVTTSYRAYLYKSVRYRSYNYIKWQLNRTEPLDTDGYNLASQSLSPDEILLFSELHRRVESIVQDLPPQCRRAYLLNKVEGKKYEEVARELGISIKAVEGLVSRGVARLRKELKDNWFLGLLVFF